ncbi:hypothetical protein ARHIZOSPH14_23040 [Agromyces rhizosphaerae]|uniref:S8 family serine peptidase n=1 Tax=Agromyces rhizosphaerae TaxID=88374 RepID=A0A9W6CWV0_9MICO|nr:S8 family peptidase [Agromyces rhizosphaerae]GLI28062.1 hypothetical protein ARHIZOSPH14_23040 [Agromyces rhizosphaerae]
MTGATGFVDLTDFADGRYIVTLKAPAVAAYEGGEPGLKATKPGKGTAFDADSPAAKAYAKHLESSQDDAADSVGAEVDTHYTTALNGFAAELTAEQAAELAATPGVVGIEADELRKLTATPSTEFLGLGAGAAGAGGVWDAIGGRDAAGEGVVVGVLDTGIAPENASFAGAALGTTPGDEPYLDGDAIVFEKADGGTFTGVCVEGEQFAASDCSTKVIGARHYVDGFGADRIGDASIGEYLSPRDGDGHGSHTASTAAGEYVGAVSVGSSTFDGVVGVAPAAKIAAYKVCWSGPDPASQNDDGCATSDLLSAIDDAVADGVDVINFSIGGGAATTSISATDVAFLGAAAAGVFVSASAGNSGPGASTLDHASPWITTVAATTIPSYEATLTLGDGSLYAGGSVTVPAAGLADVPLVRADQIPAAGVSAADALLCGIGTLDPAGAAGKVVYCDRGAHARVDKSLEVSNAGGVGMIMANPSPNSIDLDLHSVPTIHIADTVREPVFEYAATSGATVSFETGHVEGALPATPPAPQIAGFSSRGPALAEDSDVLKPDIAAPGVAILAASANAEGADGTYAFLSGTSMAAPHIAGLAALYLGVHPEASPMEVKSAMMTTAYDLVDAAGDPVSDVFAQGAGHVDPTSFLEPGLVYESDLLDWFDYVEGSGYDVGGWDTSVDPSDLNQASISVGSLAGTQTVTRTVRAMEAGTYAASVEGLAGVDVSIEPSSLTLAAGEEATFAVTFLRTDAALERWVTGSVTWTSGATEVRSPVAVKPVAVAAPGSLVADVKRGAFDVTVVGGLDGSIPLEFHGLAEGELLAQHQAKRGTSATGSAGEAFQWIVELPEGVSLQRWDLVNTGSPEDLDLYVYKMASETGPLTALWYSATGATDERVDLADPASGYYLVIADVYSGSDVSFALTSYSVMPDGDGHVALDPDELALAIGEESTFELSWKALNPRRSYLGLVEYGDTGVTTVVEVAP